MASRIAVLLVEDDPGHVGRVREALDDDARDEFDLGVAGGFGAEGAMELVAEADLGRLSARAGKGSGRALLGDDVACECELLFVLADA